MADCRGGRSEVGEGAGGGGAGGAGVGGDGEGVGAGGGGGEGEVGVWVREWGRRRFLPAQSEILSGSAFPTTANSLLILSSIPDQ